MVLQLATADRVTGAEAYYCKLRDPQRVRLAREDYDALMGALSEVYPDFSSAHRLQIDLAEGRTVESAPAAYLLGELVGSSGDTRTRKASFMLQQRGNVLWAGQVRRIIQFGVKLPESKQQWQLALEPIDDTTPSHRKRAIDRANKEWQQRPTEQHLWMQVEWFEKVIEPEVDEVDQLQQAMAPRFYTSKFDDNPIRRWLPVQRMLARFVPLQLPSCDKDEEEGTMFICRLPRKVGL